MHRIKNNWLHYGSHCNVIYCLFIVLYKELLVKTHTPHKWNAGTFTYKQNKKNSSQLLPEAGLAVRRWEGTTGAEKTQTNTRRENSARLLVYKLLQTKHSPCKSDRRTTGQLQNQNVIVARNKMLESIHMNKTNWNLQCKTYSLNRMWRFSSQEQLQL